MAPPGTLAVCNARLCSVSSNSLLDTAKVGRRLKILRKNVLTFTRHLPSSQGQGVGEGRRCVVGALGGDWEAESSASIQRKNIFWGARGVKERREREDQVFDPEFEIEKEIG